MSPEAQRIAIAEACGWKAIRMSRKWELSDDPGCPQDWSGRHPIADAWSHIPDYLSDLNAMHEAEKVLQHFGAYHDILSTVMCQPRNGIMLIRATAGQRTEAFLRTIEKWEDKL